MTYPEAGTITAGGDKASCGIATEGSVMQIAEIQKMVMIPEERYDRMLESYDKAVNTTGKLVKEVSAMQAELDRRTIIENEAILLISKCRFLEAMELLAMI